MTVIGSAPVKAGTCYRCHGKGIVYFQYGTGTYGHNNSKRQCPICHQMVPSGVTHTDPCPDCGGSGQTRSNTRSGSSSRSSSSSSSSSYSGGYQSYGTLTPNEQLQLDMMKAQYKGYEGFMNQNRCYGKINKYNPQNHHYLSVVTGDIKKENSGRLAAFSASGAGVVIRGNNGYCYQGLPKEMVSTIDEINTQKGRFIDITISDYGKYWCVVHDRNGTRYWRAMADQSIYDQLHALDNAGKKVCTVALDDFSHYIIACDDGTTVCSKEFEDLVNKARAKYGDIKSASFTAHGGCVMCCERGVYFNSIASSVADVLKKLSFLPRCIKVSYTGHYFISDNSDNGLCYYWM